MKKIALVLAVAMGLTFSANAFAVYPAHVAVGKQVVVHQPVKKVVVHQPVKKVVVKHPVKVYPRHQYVQTYQPVERVVVHQPRVVVQETRSVDPTFRAVAATILGVGLIAAALAN